MIATSSTQTNSECSLNVNEGPVSCTCVSQVRHCFRINTTPAPRLNTFRNANLLTVPSEVRFFFGAAN